MRRLSRRGFLAGLGLATGALGTTGLAGCGLPGAASVNSGPTIPAAEGRSVKLTYWAWLKDLQKVCDIWNAAHPDIHVDAVFIPGGNSGGYAKTHAALAAGGGPDLAQIEFRTIPEFILADGLIDLARYGANDYADRFDQNLWHQASFVGGVYGIPQDSGPMGLYYRPDILSGVDAEAPTTWEEWAAVAAELRKKDVYIDCFALSDPSWFTAIAGQAGARWFDVEDDTWTINLLDQPTLDTAKFFDKAIDDDLVTTAFGAFSTPWFAAASDGKIAALASASWGDALLEGVSKGEGKWRVAPLPRWGSSGYGSSYLGGSTSAVLANSEHPYEAMQFAIWLNSSKEGIDALIEHCGIGWSVSPDYIGKPRQQPSKFFGGQNYNEDVFLPATKQQNPNWMWWAITQQSFNIIADGFRRKATGVPLVDSLATAEQNIIKAFRDLGLSIKKVGS